ncbi:MAG: pilus assembly PilX N-terminal domain-containing protein [Burkholderiales bacterium]|nr:pilus assembly PilX N-terminal domain-containing protein [Burkholderiales bacterium]MDE2276148.1 pilus assembly PilX N-terminal domain-containing protein [Burkholderiales bacterium]
MNLPLRRLQLGRRARRHPAAPPARQRGAGALIVVLVLFFVISLVAAYANRNIIFEQKISANQYRSTQAFEAAEAGIEWALALLNGGKVDDNCLPSATGTSFRARYLNIDTGSGVVTSRLWPNPTGGPNRYAVQCVANGGGWSCSCPTNAAPSLTAPTTSATAPAFQVSFLPSTGGPGYVTLRAQGCTRLDAGCLSFPPNVSEGDAADIITAVVALKGALATPPAAALTTAPSAAGTPGQVDFSAGGTLAVTNAEPLVNGLTIDAAGSVSTANLTLTSTPGSPAASSYLAGDSTMPAPLATTPAPSANDALFATVFGMSRTAYQQQPATITLNCPLDCSASNLASVAAANPGRILWLEGDAALSGTSPTSIGSPTAPVVLVSHGNLTVAGAPVTLYGLLYSYDAAGTWATGGPLAVVGAALVEGDALGTGSLAVSYDLPTLARLRLASGSFVRVPGSWLDN